MGERCKIAVFDLDGTLIKGSSFNRFIWFLTKKLFKSGNYLFVIIVVYNFILQVLRLKLRGSVKFRIMLIADNYLSSDDYFVFANQIVSRMNSDLIKKIRDFQSTNILTVLLSASPEQYVSQISSILNFDYDAGTTVTNSIENYQETRGGRKVQILNNLIPEYSKIEYIFTDHHDDFKLIESNNDATIYLINPSKKLKALCDMYGIDYKLNTQHD
ncbi:MAG: haloacid dehalogenase-like hydrolase [Muribaculaceae bacterium]|nr:haloacid dehalogenase-like hydrolase [Muribaculaceae bacterium]